ncbi:MAG: hypothetical protein ACRETY_09275 [Steroidobacteraceae bacterium]
MRRGRGAGPPFRGLQWEPKQRRARSEKRRVAREDQLAGPVDEGRGKRKLRTDAGRLAGGYDYSARPAQGFLIST